MRARCFTGDSWRSVEHVTSESCESYWPSMTKGDSSRPFLAFYNGSYPTDGSAANDSWAIYTTTRTISGWSPRQVAHPMMMETFPTGIKLGRARDGSIGMVWSENHGGMNTADSVMFSHLTSEGWTPRKCLAPGHNPDVNCSDASLIPGDSTEFYVAFARGRYPDGDSVEIWTLNDSLVSGPTAFAGHSPRLARGVHPYFAFVKGDTLLCSVNYGSGWDTPQRVATGLGTATSA